MLRELLPHSPELAAVVLPVLIFVARIIDVSLGTVRIVLVSRGHRVGASLLGFLEVLLWLVTISQVLQHMEGWISYVSYAAGFGAGTYVGMSIERRLAIGKSIIRIVTGSDTGRLVRQLRANGFKSTRVPGDGPDGPVEVVFSVVSRRSVNKLLALVKSCSPDAFYSIEDVRAARDGPEQLALF